MFTGFYYLHENGSLLYKPHANHEDMNSTFVKHYWTANEFGGDRPQAFLGNLKQAKRLGANWEDIMRLVNHNKLTNYLPNCVEELKYV